jgi:hypothetical protein
MRSKTDIIVSWEIGVYRFVIPSNVLEENVSSVLSLSKLAELRIWK